MKRKQARDTEIRKWVNLLKSALPTERFRGASELASLGVRTRGAAVRTRGSVSRPAPSRLPSGVRLDEVLTDLRNEHADIRSAVVFALGEWEDDRVLPLLGPIASGDPESAVRGEAIDATGKIGGATATKIVMQALATDPAFDVRVRAVRVLAELASAEAEPALHVRAALKRASREDSFEPVREQARMVLRTLRSRAD